MNGKKFSGVLGIGFGLLVLSLDWSIVNNALPAIQKSLLATLSDLQWIINIFALVVSALLVTMGRLSDAFGRKKMFAVGLWMGVIASLGAALSPTAGVLIIFRAFQGIAASIIVPASQSLMTHTFPENQHGKAMGIWVTIIGVGLSLGPVLGGLIVEYFSWHWVFYFNLPFLLISFFLVTSCLEESRNEKQPIKIDFPGILLLTFFLGCFLLATIQAPSWGWTSAITLSLYALSVVTLIGFALSQYHTKVPLIEFHLFKNRRFISGALTKVGIAFSIWGIFFLLPLFFQNIQKLSPGRSGLFLLMLTACFTLTSHLTGRISDRIPKKSLILAGLLLISISLFFNGFISPNSSPYILLIFLGMFGIGWGLSSGPGTSMGIAALPRHVTGVASGTLVTLQEIGGAIGLAVIGTVFRVYNNGVFEKKLALSHLNLSPSLIEKIQTFVSSNDTLASIIAKLPVATQEEIFAIFQEAFMVGFHRGLWIAFGVVAAFLLVIFGLLRRES
ncbi:MAG: MFS transporter [Simkania sp.]|nr:MFS transporter [Simkania sp.]